MLRRRVPVLRLGSRGPGGDARSLRLWTQACASVRGASHLRRTCRRNQNRRETQNCRHFWTRLGSSRLKSVNSHSQGSGGSWSRNAELSSLLDSPRERGKERRVDRRKERGERRGEERGEERRGEERRGEERERREEREQRREDRGGKRERRGERG